MLFDHRAGNAVSGVSVELRRGETLGLVGESGCGKSTLGKAIVRLAKPTSGSVVFQGEDLLHLSSTRLRAVRAKLQMIFQDPVSSLNPRRRVAEIVREPLEVWKVGDKPARGKRVRELLEQVGIDPDLAGQRRPQEFSGGQCQRISIARALALEPELIICDEPVSALDVSVQAQILNLLEDLKERLGLTLVFISHDLAVVKSISDRVAVMYLGKIVETAPAGELYENPRHHYTAALLAAIPDDEPGTGRTIEGVQGELPSPLAPPSGCRFRTRCPRAEARCAEEEPRLRAAGPIAGHLVACHFPQDAG